MEDIKLVEGAVLNEPAASLPTIHLAKKPNTEEVDYWLSFFKPGPLEAKDLLGHQSLEELITALDDGGLNNPEPLLISRQDIPQPFLIMLLSAPESYANADLMEYCLKARSQLQGIGRSKLGIHIPAGFLPPVKTLLFLGEILQKLYTNQIVNEVHLSLSGYPLHDRLNLTWRIQNHLKRIGQPILLYH